MQHLHQTFFYQNPNTKQPSSSTLSSLQICRLLCPATCTGSIGGANRSSLPSIINLDTLVIEYDPVTNQYSTDGWVTLSKYPLFQYVAASWYYSESVDGGVKQENKSNDTRQEKSTDAEGKEEIKSNSVVKGPISFRDLTSLYYQVSSSPSSDCHVNDSTRVWSPSLSCTQNVDCKQKDNDTISGDGKVETKWTTISELPLLKLGMEAFEDVINITFFNDSKSDNDNHIMMLEPLSQSSSSRNTNKIEFNEQDMVYDDDTGMNQAKGDDNKIDNLLEEFLSSTGGEGGGDEDVNNVDIEEYQSDGGTNYHKIDGHWVDSSIIPPSEGRKKRQLQEQNADSSQQEQKIPKKKKIKRSKPKFSQKNAKHWIYVSNLPIDTNETEVAAYFSKVGILDIDPDTQKPKIKLYKEKNTSYNINNEHGIQQQRKTKLKGDASICYANSASVQMAIQLLDDTCFRTIDPKTNQPLDYELTKKQKKIRVQQAKFEQKSDLDYTNASKKKSSVSDKKRQVARIAKLQAITWDEGDYNGRITGGIKGLRIIVLKYVFTIGDVLEAKKRDKVNGEKKLLESIDNVVRSDCENFGAVEKITIFSKNPDGVIIVKFTQPSAASDAIKFYNSGEKDHVMARIIRSCGGSQKEEDHHVPLEAGYWDGVTDYIVRDEAAEEEDMKKRHDEFGDWLDCQEIPDEFKLKVEKG